MSTFTLTLVPASQSPVIRDMFRQRREIVAPDIRSAKRLVKEAFPDGFDLTGEWQVEGLS